LDELGKVANKEIVAAVKTRINLDISKVRFDSKARAAESLGIIDTGLADELIAFYSARNLIHIHAELGRGADWEWKVEFARQAYWRLQKFKQQVLDWQA